MSPQKFGEWLPIETAPKKSDLVLLFNNGEVVMGFKVPSRRKWWIFGLDDLFKPTHWMPLPPPPETKE